jgi:DNA/RNA endonuclease YhcR with UshA esterase domain
MNRRVHPHFNILLSFFSSLIFMLVVFIGLPSNLFAQYKEIRDDEAKAHVGEMVTVRGVIANVRTSKAGNTFINFGRPSIYQTFTAVIFRDKAHLFRNVHSLEGKEVSVTGVIRLYKGKPEIILNEPRQLMARGNGRDSAGLR